MKKPKIANWCTWPRRDHAEDINQLYRTGARCDAWRAFLSSKTVAAFRRVKGNVIWFNRYEHFDHLIVEFDCSESALRALIAKLLRPEFRGKAFTFQRNDIYDARAWAHIPLNWFARIDEREIPDVQFGIKLPVTVPRDCFTLSHRLKHGGRFAEITFTAPWLDKRFRGQRWCADGHFDKAATRAEMTASLFAQVEQRCADYRVTISTP